MPASEFSWPRVSQFNSFTVIGRSKRKADLGHEDFQAISEHAVSKRLCNWPDVTEQFPHPVTKQHEDVNAVEMIDVDDHHNATSEINHSEQPEINHNAAHEINHNEPPEINQNYMQSIESLHTRGPRDDGCFYAVQVDMLAAAAHSEVLAASNVLSPQQAEVGAGIMDLCDETYNMYATDDALISAPLTQATPTQATSTAERTPPHSQTGSDFCREFCGAGETSPTSGRVRCYCKPSWEGMLDTRPYISDVY